MLPVLLGLSVVQLNSLFDSLVAWLFAQPEFERILPGGIDSPITTGSASALYLGQRMFQFPLGVFGIALGTVMFPRMTHHASLQQWEKLRSDLTLGLQLVIAVGLPASIGLMLLSEPLTALLFQYGAFDAQDAVQTQKMIAGYGVGVWAACGLMIVHRCCYACDDLQTPLRIGIYAAVLNMFFSLGLIWILGASGLAWGTSLALMIQLPLVIRSLQHRIGSPDWNQIQQTTFKAIIATACMGICCVFLRDSLSASSDLISRIIRLLLPLAVSVIVYVFVAWKVSLREFFLLFRRE